METDWFHQALERIGASQADLARQLRLAPSAVSRMLKGERQMKLLEAVQIAQFLGAPQEEVLRHAGAGDAPQGRGETSPARGRRGRPPTAAPRLPGG
ncbi:MAG TPA: helix-turn-helix transcriptional regulator, partial [Stellaceae bacterium]|nr:helix-turn-helix transcriptional regulator [Stellaceae bacterium]